MSDTTPTQSAAPEQQPAAPAAPTPPAAAAIDTPPVAALPALDAELEELLRPSVAKAVETLLDAIEHERSVPRQDIAEISIQADGVVRLLTRGRVRRSLRVAPFASTEISEDVE